MDTSRRMAAWLAASIAAIAIPCELHAAVGRTHGVASVSPGGAATYSIRLTLPPGTKGMTPQLALAYDHRNTNTLLGVGWSVAGLPAIERCPRTWAQNGEPRDVRNDLSDRFCLQGNQLRLVSGTYGENGAEYRTEIETFSRIRSYGSAGNGPAYFVVEQSDGLIYEYGNTADSRIESLGQSTARTWAVNEIRDRAGNSIVFSYTEDASYGSYRISTIQYTSNPDQGLSPAYTVSFAYEAKPVNEIDSEYLAGGLIKEVTRLDRVDVTHQGSVVRRYELTYEGTLSSTSKSRLAAIQECAGSSLDCFPATTFSYQDGTIGLSAEVNTSAAVPTLPWSMDVNGDGRDDLVYSSSITSGSGHWMVMFANVSGGYDAPISTGVVNHNWAGAIDIDYNADGLGDLLVPYSGGTWWVMLGTASGLAPPTNVGAPATGTGNNARAIDINGDGLQDLVWADLVGNAGGDAIRYRLRERSGTFSSTVYTLVGPLPADSWIFGNLFAGSTARGSKRVMDFNGDGRADLVYQRIDRVWQPEVEQWSVSRTLNVICPGAWSFSTALSGADGHPIFGDFNGDGKDDLLYSNVSGNSWYYRFSRGTSFGETLTRWGMSGYAVGSRMILDWDGDGHDDVLVPQTSGGAWYLVRSTGESLLAPVDTGLAGGSNLAVVTDLNGDGLDDLSYSASGVLRFRTHAGTSPDLLQTATDGFGNSVSFNYAALTGGYYTKQADASFPEQDYVGPLQVVHTMTGSDGVDGTYSLSYQYAGARVHLQGRGFEGFQTRRTHDSRNGLYAYDHFHRLFPYTGALTRSDLYQPDGSTLISRRQNTWNAHTYSSGAETRVLPYVSASSASRYELGGSFNGALISTTTTANSIDAATGVLYDSTTTTTEASTANGVQAGASYVQRVYQPTANFVTDWTNWCLGRPGRIQSIRSHNQYGGSAVTRTTAIDWDTLACRPTQEVIEPGHAELQVTRTLSYDGHGNVSSETVTGVGMSARTTTTNWDARGQFPSSITNALSQTKQFDWDPVLGVQTSETDPNGIEISWEHDGFGRRTREDRPDGTATTWRYEDCASVGCLNANNKMVVVETELADGSTVTDRRLYADRFDRPIGSSARMLSGAYNRVERAYDALGRVDRESAPCWSSNCSPHWTTYSYDLLGRVTQVSRPTSDSNAALQTSDTYYEGLTSRLVDPLGKESTKVANVADAAARSMDHDGYYQNFDYDPFGNVRRVTDSLGNALLSNTFNLRGMRTGQTDLAAGSWSYTPNALGEIVAQTDAKNQPTTFEYDALGRLISRTEPEGTGTWTWGTSASARNIGRLQSMSGPGYAESYQYDGVGRLQRTTITSDATYTIDYAYNSLGALDTLRYPTSTAGYRLSLKYDYQNGLLLRVKDENAPATAFWTAHDTDARGNIVNETLGNGIQTIRGYDGVTGRLDYIQSGAGGAIQNLNYTWDPVGNLTQREDIRQGLAENFYYDNLHRLTSTTGPDPLSIAYDARGNAISKTGALSPGVSHTITWYSYNLPNEVSGPSGYSSEFFYTPERARYKQAANYGGTGETTMYIGGLVEKVTLGTVTSWKHYIAGAGGAVAVYTRKSNGSNEIHYLTKDHQGSVDTVTDATGNVEVRLSFGSLGQRRKEAGWSGMPTSADWAQITDTTRRGYTAHEMLDNLNLIHMNGRVYDPLVGRFVSPDPFIDGAMNTQGWNRYSYVKNRPLSFVDPSGFDDKDIKVDGGWGGGGGGASVSEVVVTASRINGDGFSNLREISPELGVGVINGTWEPEPDLDLDSWTGTPEGNTIEEVIVTAAAGTHSPSSSLWDLTRSSSTASMVEEVVVEARNPCSAPAFPRGASVDQNIRTALNVRRSILAEAGFRPPYATAGTDITRRLDYFYGQVRNSGPWDYKQLGNQFEQAGNFNYGATGAALGIPSQVLYRGAGVAQGIAGTSDPAFGSPFGASPYGDDPVDQIWIQHGIDYFRSKCSSP